MVRVFLGYHSEMVGDRISEILRDLTDVDLAGVVYQSAPLLNELDRSTPDVAILDIRLLFAAQIRDFHSLKLRYPNVRFVLLYDYPYSRLSRECQKFGAEYCFDIHHEFSDLGTVLGQIDLPHRFESSSRAS